MQVLVLKKWPNDVNEDAFRDDKLENKLQDGGKNDNANVDVGNENHVEGDQQEEIAQEEGG